MATDESPEQGPKRLGAFVHRHRLGLAITGLGIAIAIGGFVVHEKRLESAGSTPGISSATSVFGAVPIPNSFTADQVGVGSTLTLAGSGAGAGGGGGLDSPQSPAPSAGASPTGGGSSTATVTPQVSPQVASSPGVAVPSSAAPQVASSPASKVASSPALPASITSSAPPPYAPGVTLVAGVPIASPSSATSFTDDSAGLYESVSGISATPAWANTTHVIDGVTYYGAANPAAAKQAESEGYVGAKGSSISKTLTPGAIYFRAL